MKGIFLKLAFNILKNYMNFITIYHLAPNHGLIMKKAYRVIKLNQNAWLKPYIDMNTDLRKKNKK